MIPIGNNKSKNTTTIISNSLIHVASLKNVTEGSDTLPHIRGNFDEIENPSDFGFDRSLQFKGIE